MTFNPLVNDMQTIVFDELASEQTLSVQQSSRNSCGGYNFIIDQTLNDVLTLEPNGLLRFQSSNMADITDNPVEISVTASF